MSKDNARCINCAYCSESYPSFIVSCDRDGHIVQCEEKEGCVDFIISEDADMELSMAFGPL